MKALTVMQPYAHLIASGKKIIENRQWASGYRGPLLIHAGKSRAWLDDGDDERYPTMLFGAVLAVADMVGCVPLNKLPDAYRNHQHAHGPFCWLLANVRALPQPVVANGAQGLWSPDSGLRGAVLEQLGVVV